MSEKKILVLILVTVPYTGCLVLSTDGNIHLEKRHPTPNR